MGEVAERIHARLASALQPTRLEVIDDSHRHAGHSGARPGGETHFSVTIRSAAFAGVGRVQRQRMVHALLKAPLEQGVHALSIKALAPGEG